MRRRVVPKYPDLPRENGIIGTVFLRAVIKADGTVGQIEVMWCDSPHVGFEQAAVESVKTWQYVAARKGGKPVWVYLDIQVKFPDRPPT